MVKNCQKVKQVSKKVIKKTVKQFFFVWKVIIMVKNCQQIKKNQDFKFLTGSKWFVDDFEKMTFSFFSQFFSKIFKNRSKVTLLPQTDLGNMIFMKKPSRLIPEKPIFDPRWPILWFFCDSYHFLSQHRHA